MGALFVSASSQYLNMATSLPFTGYPYSVGFWVRPNTASVNRACFSLKSSSTHYLTIKQGSGNVWHILANAGGVERSATTGVVTQNAWHYVLGRFISATNRRISVISATGAATHAQQTTNNTPNAATAFQIGAQSDFASGGIFDGHIAELFYTNTDVQSDGAQTLEPFLRRLAYRGPFGVPEIARDIVEYFGFYQGVAMDRMHPRDYYAGKFGKLAWVPGSGANVPSPSLHPPLPAGYVSLITNRSPRVPV